MSLLEAEHTPEVWAPDPSLRRSGWRRIATEGTAVFVVALCTYVAVAVYLILVNDVIFPDALSRVGNAQYVIASRDRHLAAIGFVWNPLPSLVLVPFIPLRHVWPQLISTGFLGALSSALFMAGAAAVIRSILQDVGLGRVGRLALVATFALNPMIVLYGSNGESEAALIFFAVLAIRFLVAWLGRPSTRALCGVGIALAGAYLTRYEAVAPGLAVILLVPVVSALRAKGSWLERRQIAIADALIVGMPFALTFVGWAVVSRVIVKQWFPTLQSDYGNTNQVGLNRRFIFDIVGRTAWDRAHYAGHQLLALEPAVPVVVLLAAALLLVRRDLRLLAPVAVAGAVLAFDAVAFLAGSSFGWLRFQIAVIPLAVVLAGLGVAALPRLRWVRVVGAVVAVAMTAPAAVTTAAVLLDRTYAREEAKPLRSVLRPASLTPTEQRQVRRFDVEWDIAKDIDSRHLRHGSVLTDVAFSFGVLLASKDPQAFVITPDQDFEPAVADPTTFHVQYLLLPSPKAASYDALNVAFPGAFDHGLPGAALVKEWKGRGGPDWRLYRLAAAAHRLG